MKKLLAAITALTMTVILAVGASAATSPDQSTTRLGGAVGYNQSANDYLTYARTIKSYIEETDKGFRRIEYYNNKLTIEEYDKSFALKSTKTITKNSYIFGGYYQGSDYCYLVWGQNNPEENDNQEVLLIEKYTKGLGTKKGSVSVYGANTYIPFDAGSLRMTETAGRLYIHTAHEMYVSDDGYHHQANMTFVVDTITMTVADSWYDVWNISGGYVSHSFNQFIETDGRYIYRVDHGDAYPRSVVITKCAVGGDITDVSYTNALPISGAIGDNFTGVSVGGVELTANNVIIAGNTADQSSDYISYYSKRNIFITVTDKNLSKTTVKYLTNYTDDDEAEVCTPHLVKINDNKFLVMWEELKDYTIYTRLCTIDGQGNLTSEIVDTYMYLSDCAPVLFSDGLVYWYKSDTSGATLYRVNPDDLTSANNGEVKKTENFKATATDTSVTLSWDMNNSAASYNVERYENGYWYPVVGIAQNFITNTKVEDLTPATTYKFRIIPYKLIGDTWVFGEPTEVTVTTAIPDVEGFILKGRASTALRVNWNVNSYADGYVVEQKINNKWTTIADIADSATTTYRIGSLASNTSYSFRVKAYSKKNNKTIYSSYTDTITATTSPAKVSGFRLGGRSASVLRLNWNKDSNATGYIIEQYKNGKWERLTKITNNSTTTYRVTGLNAGTTYKFRMKAYKYTGSSYYIGDYTGTLTSTTSPSEVQNLRLGGRKADVIRLNWNKNESATGYIIEQYKDGKWVRIAKITKNSTTTYRVTGLKPSTTYKFRIKAYKMVGKVGLHGAYTDSFSATTSPSAVTNLKISEKRFDSLKLVWNKNTSADGYIIEQYIDGKWVRIKKYTSNSSTSFRVSGLKSGTAYKFRVKTYNMEGKVGISGEYVNIEATTL